jgi:hypothetical protein
MKLEKFLRAAETCDTILAVVEEHEALIIKGTCCAAI